MSHQQFSQLQGRLTQPARPMHGGLGGQLQSTMPMRGLTGSLGGMGTQALASGLEELKRTAGAVLHTDSSSSTAAMKQQSSRGFLCVPTALNHTLQSYGAS
jgi:hypothetical protein